MSRPRLLILLACILYAACWWGLRSVLEARLAAAAERDLETIVDLVAAEFADDDTRHAAGSPAGALPGASAALARTLQQAEDENRRRVYFFDRNGTALQIAPTGGAMTAADGHPEIIDHALRGGAGDARRRGARFEPYPTFDGELGVGVWRWLESPPLGIVAERPHATFIQPVRWIDGLFFGLACVVLLGIAFLRRVGLDDLRRAFRRAEIGDCGPYRIVRLLGDGTVANVYLARHRHLGRLVALKQLKLQSRTEEVAARFDREARLASRLAHPNIITVLDHGHDAENGFYYAMEYIHGLTLTQWVREHGPLPPARAVRLLRQICAAVGAMHARHLLHRDIKPDNVMAYAAHDDHDLVKLLDFGLIKDLENSATRDLTRNVRVLGTPAFMAPERLLDPRAIDPRTDLYGIGCIGFYLMTGRLPFEASRDADLAQQVQFVPAPSVSTHSIFAIPPALDALIASALAKRMEHRPRDAESFAAELDRIAASVPWRRELARSWWLSAMSAADKG